MNLAGRSFIVTGGAGHLGRHVCVGLANEKADVLCLSSRRGDFDGLVKIGHAKIESVVCDVSDEAEFERHVRAFSARFGPINGLVNGAVKAPRGIDLDMPRDQFRAGLDSILTHYFTCSRIARRYMPKGGSIVNMVSMWGKKSPEPAVYLDLKNEPSIVMAAAAGGILSMTRYLAILLAEDNIRVNVLMPGWFPKKRGPERSDYMAEIKRRVPMRRIGAPAEIVGAVLFLLSDESSYMTGQELIIDGGFTCQ